MWLSRLLLQQLTKFIDLALQLLFPLTLSLSLLPAIGAVGALLGQVGEFPLKLTRSAQESSLPFLT